MRTAAPARVVPALAVALVLSSCIVEAPSGQSGSEKSGAVVSRIPPLTVQSGALLGDKVELLGATIQPPRVVPGETVRVTAYYRALDDMDIDYMVFVHGDDAEGQSNRLNADHSPANGSYPTTRWRKGEQIRDEFSLHIPRDLQTRGINLFVGFWDPRTDERLPLRNPDRVRNDGNNRVLLAQIPLSP